MCFGSVFSTKRALDRFYKEFHRVCRWTRVYLLLKNFCMSAQKKETIIVNMLCFHFIMCKLFSVSWPIAISVMWILDRFLSPFFFWIKSKISKVFYFLIRTTFLIFTLNSGFICSKHEIDHSKHEQSTI